MSALAHIFQQVIREIFGENVQARCDHEFVAIQWSVGTHQIDGLGNLPQYAVIGLQQLEDAVLVDAKRVS